MAEAVLERTMHKVEKSKGRGRSVQDRAKAWDLINKRAEEEEKAARGEGDSDEGAGEDDGKKDDGWVTDEDMDANEETSGGANADPTAGADFIPIDDEDIL